jgi:hypothetical protein
MPDSNQDQDYQLTGDQLSELHGLASQMQVVNDPRAVKLWNLIAAQSGGADSDVKPQFTVYRAPLKVTTWLEDLENDLWGDQSNASTAQNTQIQDSVADDGKSEAASPEMPQPSEGAAPVADIETPQASAEGGVGASPQTVSTEPGAPSTMSMPQADQPPPEGMRGHELMDNRDVQSESYKLFGKSAYGNAQTEHSMWVISKDGQYRFVPWPWSAQSAKEIWKGPAPPGSVAIIHTHPTATSERPSPGDYDLANGRQAKDIHMPVYVLHRNGIWKAVTGGKDAVRVRDYRWPDEFKP